MHKMRSKVRSGISACSKSSRTTLMPPCKDRRASMRLLAWRTGVCISRARASRLSRATPEKSTAVTFWPRAARSSACLPVPHPMSSAGPFGRSGKSSRTMLAGSEGGASAAALCLASQSDWLEGIKKAPELTAQEPQESFCAHSALPRAELDAERAPTAAGALHVGIVEFKSRTFERLNVINLNSVQVHGTHLVDRHLQTVELEKLVRIGGLVFKRHMVLKSGASAADNRHAQSNGHGVLHAHDFLDLGTRNGRQINHKSSWPPLAGKTRQAINNYSIPELFHRRAKLRFLLRNSRDSPRFDKNPCFAYNEMQ